MEAVPGWRKPIALVGWAVLIAFLIGVIVWGLNQLAQDRATPSAVTTTTTAPPATTATPTTTTTTTPPSADSTTPSTTPTTPADAATTTKAPSRGAFPHMPSVITLPSLPVITLPPGR
jgi:cytoskeletal protein RodZ